MSWSTCNFIKSRRESFGMSQSDVAKKLGVTKSLLSHLESGKRLPTDDQIEKLAELLGVPKELLILGSGRLPEDVRDLFDNHAAEAVAAIREFSESHVLNYPTVPQMIPVASNLPSPVGEGELPERIAVKRSSSASRTHSYHTKVPPDAITPFIRAFSRPGETILDPFCGSGMTGVAALMEGRNALLSDVSPAAVHIARNYTSPVDPTVFSEALGKVESLVKPTIDWLYRPPNSKSIVEYTTWSDILRCPACRGEVLYWDLVHNDKLQGRDLLACPHCGEKQRKGSFDWAGEKPVESHTSSGSTRIDTHLPTQDELALIDSAEISPIPYWTPSIPFGSEREMWRASHRAMGINNVVGFFTKRNLHALAALRHAIVSSSTGRVREALMFAFTGAVNRASRRYQWNAKRPTNVMTGTLYISSLRYEWNVWSLFRRKAAEVLRYYKGFSQQGTSADVFQRSAASLDCIPDKSIDMIFMDPPFGSNIFYADASLLWESWLGDLTDQAAEMVVNKHRKSAGGGKSIEDYGALMERAFSHGARVLKPGGRAVLAFSNSDDRVWQAVQDALYRSGFQTESVHLLHKGQPSIKGVKGVTGKERVTTLDLLICLKHRDGVSERKEVCQATFGLIDGVILGLLAEEAGSENLALDEIYSAVIRAVIEADYSVVGITMPTIEERLRKLGAISIKGGRWQTCVLQEKNADFFSGYLTAGEMLPISNRPGNESQPLGNVRVSGGRGSVYYLAHSYHTKVPPEAIQPFIEHFTKPGDVVLDPFCGSGMTGVAAALSGRQGILSDLSPAAIHLAWNHTRPCDPSDLEKAFKTIEAKVIGEFRDLYRTKHTDETQATINWVMWSTEHQCPQCLGSFLLWDAIDRTSGRIGTGVDCPLCQARSRRRDLPSLGSRPAWIAYKTPDGKHHAKAASKEDVEHAISFQRSEILDWYPETALSADREMYIRCALQRHGVKTVADFYTARNLKALALLWKEIMAVPDNRIRRALAFAFTNTAWHGTKMRRFNARGGQRPLTGTLYIPQLSSEANVLSVMRNKISQLKRYYRAYKPHGVEMPALQLGSAGDLSQIADNSIDYVFTDPPFGSNIFYADCNLIWESWLGRLTETSHEAVVNRSLSSENGGKTLKTYSDLMNGAMREIARVLKPGGWATVVFHNTDAKVWQALRDAAESAGFSFHEAASLDRAQQSHKGYKGRSGVEDVAHFDVVFNLKKPLSEGVGEESSRPTPSLDLDHLVAELILDKDIGARGLQGLHSEVMRRLASENLRGFVDYADIRASWERVTKDGAAGKSSS